MDKRQGSIFNTAGDSVLAEFPSAVNAVECAVEFQNKIRERNQSEKTTTKLEYRVGINMGDVVSRDGNLLGDGVNIAARLEALCQTNGVCISKSIYDLVVPKTKMTFNDLGVQKVKQNTFHAYDVLIDPSQKRKIKKKSNRSSSVIGLVIILVLVVLAGGYALYLSKDDARRLEEAQFQDTSRPIVLVAPIKASGSANNLESFANGITESMISAFSSYKGVRVLSSNTSFYASEKKMTDSAIRDDYGVKFIVRGSIQVMGENARLNLQVTNTILNEVVASKKRDFELSNVFAVQDELSGQILNLLQTDLGVGKYASTWAKNFDSVEDLTTWLNWIREWRKFSKEGHEEAQRLYNGLREKYPDENTAMYIGEAWQLNQRLSMGLSKNPEQDKDRLQYVLNKAVEFDPESSDVYNARALITLINFDGPCEDSLEDMKRAEKNGSTQETLLIGAAVYRRCGDLNKAITSMKEVLKIVPNDPGWFQTGNLVMFLFRDKQFDEIRNVIGSKINAEDMDNRVLAVFAYLAAKEGKNLEAKDYFERSLVNGFGWQRVKNLPKDVRTDVLDTLERIIPFERGDIAN